MQPLSQSRGAAGGQHTDTERDTDGAELLPRSGARKRRLSVFTHSKKKGKKRGKRAKIDMEVSTSNTFSGSLTLLFVGERTLRRLQLYT